MIVPLGFVILKSLEEYTKSLLNRGTKVSLMIKELKEKYSEAGPPFYLKSM
jgi:hypothetical protein